QTRPPQEKVTKLRRTRNLRPLRDRVSPVKPQVRRRRLAGSRGLSSEEKGRRARLRAKQLLTRQGRPPGPQLAQGQLHQVRKQGSKMSRRMRGPRPRSRIRSRCSRLNRNTRISAHSQSRSRFRQLRTLRIIGFKGA